MTYGKNVRIDDPDIFVPRLPGRTTQYIAPYIFPACLYGLEQISICTRSVVDAVSTLLLGGHIDHDQVDLVPVDGHLARPACRFHTCCWKAQEICRTQEPPLAELKPGRHVACHLPENAPE